MNYRSVGLTSFGRSEPGKGPQSSNLISWVAENEFGWKAYELKSTRLHCGYRKRSALAPRASLGTELWALRART
jgi:hypothetical protein